MGGRGGGGQMLVVERVDNEKEGRRGQIIVVDRVDI